MKRVPDVEGQPCSQILMTMVVIQLSLYLCQEYLVRGEHNTFHFLQKVSFETYFTIRVETISESHSLYLLLKVLLVESRVEHHFQIHLQQLSKVLSISASEYKLQMLLTLHSI